MIRFIEQFKLIKFLRAIACSVHLNARKFLSNLVPQCLRVSWKSAFTLAETLIVIGIIGVVAALTLPNLNHATGDKEKVTKVKKIYSALTDAVDRAQVIYGPYDEWIQDKDNYHTDEVYEKIAKRITQFLKVSKDCGLGQNSCWSSNDFVRLDGRAEWNEDYDRGYKVILSDGIALNFRSCSYGSKIKVDIDGPNRGKNQWGNDIFEFNISYNKDYCDRQYNANYAWCKLNELTPDGFPGVSPVDNYYGVTAWVIENGNLDYLKATYGEDGLECPNGKTLDWTTNTSCN